MSSLSDQLRAALTMTSDDVHDLIERGFAIEVVESLQKRGFREACPMPHDDGSTSPSFLRQTAIPHLHITLEKSATLEDLDTAIHAAAYRLGYQSLADIWHRFTDSVKSWHRPQKAHDLEARLARLETKLSHLSSPL